MPRLLKEPFVKKAIIKWLSYKGWGRNLESGELNERGVDIRVRHNNFARYFLVEVKGEGRSMQVNQGVFVNAVGQIITRMNTAAKYKYGLGLPNKSAAIAIRRVPWQIAKSSGYIFFL